MLLSSHERLNAVILMSTRSHQQQIHAMVRVRLSVELLIKVGGSARRGRDCTVRRKTTVTKMIFKKVMNHQQPRSQELFGRLNCFGNLLRLSTSLELINLHQKEFWSL